MTNRFVKIMKILKCSLLEMRVNPTVADDLVSEVRQEFSKLRPLPSCGTTGPEEAWFANMRRLRTLVAEQDPAGFLRWDVIRQTMFVANAQYSETELAFLKGANEWGNRWEPALRESQVGRPGRLWCHPETSGNLLHNAYHLARFERETGVRPTDVDTVLEFGGGYGSMCRLYQNLGFRGRYLIFDLPEFSLLQRFYLKALGFDVHTPETFRKAISGILCISDPAMLSDIVGECFSPERSLFIATWSLSESPLQVREGLLPLLRGFGRFLLAYQNFFEGVDNRAFFGNFATRYGDTGFLDFEIEHLAGSRYMFGLHPQRPFTASTLSSRSE